MLQYAHFFFVTVSAMQKKYMEKQNQQQHTEHSARVNQNTFVLLAIANNKRLTATVQIKRASVGPQIYIIAVADASACVCIGRNRRIQAYMGPAHMAVPYMVGIIYAASKQKQIHRRNWQLSSLHSEAWQVSYGIGKILKQNRWCKVLKKYLRTSLILNQGLFSLDTAYTLWTISSIWFYIEIHDIDDFHLNLENKLI